MSDRAMDEHLRPCKTAVFYLCVITISVGRLRGRIVFGGHRDALRMAALGLAVATCVSCTRAELVHKADAYDAAIWDANNRQILLNAVRASQRAPMSFVALGEVSANPVVTGSTA